jgi:hypothetical protein
VSISTTAAWASSAFNSEPAFSNSLSLLRPSGPRTSGDVGDEVRVERLARRERAGLHPRDVPQRLVLRVDQHATQPRLGKFK